MKSISNQSGSTSQRVAICAAALTLLGSLEASAHLTYPVARDFGLFSLANPRSATITGQTTKAFGWADGTDADFARQDDQRYFKFTLDGEMTITISVVAVDAANMLPAFSLYSGLGHAATDSANPDYDGATVTQTYLASLGAPQPRKGAFDALHTFKIGNDSNPAAGYVADLATLTYIGHAADGTSLNYGPAPDINGDGAADGFVTSTFTLPAGAYTLVIAGANYATTDATNRGFTPTVSSIPEPATAVLLAGGMMALGTLRRRISSAGAASQVG